MRLKDRVGGNVGRDGGKLLGYLYFGREEGVTKKRVDIGEVLHVETVCLDEKVRLAADVDVAGGFASEMHIVLFESSKHLVKIKMLQTEDQILLAALAQ